MFSNANAVREAWNSECAKYSAQPAPTSDPPSTTVGSKFTSQAEFNLHMPGLHAAIKRIGAPFATDPPPPVLDDLLVDYFNLAQWFN